MSLDQYSQIPASNDLANYFQTGMAPSAVKTAGWDIMADLAGLYGLPTSAGSANAQTITNTRKWGALDSKMFFCFLPGFSNTGACTLAVDGLTAKNIYANGAALLGGELSTTVPALVKYDGTQFNLLNPQVITGSFTITLTGMTTTTTGTCNYQISNGVAVIDFGVTTISGTSNSTSMTCTGIPAALHAASDKYSIIMLRDGDSTGLGVVHGLNTSTWTFAYGTPLSFSGFTASGTKGLYYSGFSYGLKSV